MRRNAVIILAAGSCPEDLQHHTGIRLTADLRLGDRSFVDRVVDAFKEAEFEHIAVVGTRVSGCEYVPDQGSYFLNLKAGLEAAPDNYTKVVSPCDLPFLRSQEITEFMSKVYGSQLDCAVVPVQSCHEAFPGLARTALTVKEGEFTFGNIVAGDDWVWKNYALPIVDRAYRARKSIARLALLMGAITSARYLLAKRNPNALSIQQLEWRAYRKIKVPVRAVIGDWPGMGTDIDTLDHYKKARQYVTPTHKEEVRA